LTYESYDGAKASIDAAHFPNGGLQIDWECDANG
jgi:hypothetical protein